MVKVNFDWKVWAKKTGIYMGYALITGLVVLWQDDPMFVVVMPLLLSAQNFIKHTYFA
jgi:hypothetical protein